MCCRQALCCMLHEISSPAKLLSTASSGTSCTHQGVPSHVVLSPSAHFPQQPDSVTSVIITEHQGFTPIWLRIQCIILFPYIEEITATAISTPPKGQSKDHTDKLDTKSVMTCTLTTNCTSREYVSRPRTMPERDEGRAPRGRMLQPTNSFDPNIFCVRRQHNKHVITYGKLPPLHYLSASREPTQQ